MPKPLLNYSLILSLALVCLGEMTAGNYPLLAVGYDSHVELSWQKPQGTDPAAYLVWRSADGQSFSLLKTINNMGTLDFTGFPGATPHTYYYYVAALNGINAVIAVSDTVQATVAPMSDDALLDMVQRYTFRYFWDFAHPVSGMARERNTSGDIVTTGGSGFGIMALLVGIERGYITRQQGMNRLLQITSFLQFADKYNGVFPHWLNGATGKTVPFSQFDDGADLVETSFLMQGLLCARTYFDQNDPLEDALRTSITGLWENVNWNFHRKNNEGVLYWHWSPNYQWQMNFQLRGFNEAMITYILAIASPTHPVPASLWNTGWTAQNYASGVTWYGHKLDVGPPLGGPLFFAHYSYLGFDPRHKKDTFTNYFERNKNHTLINRAYCMANPLGHAGYAADCWGLTASDNPWGYLAHEPGAGKDNGTIAPTAALASMPYTPAESMAALKHFYRVLGEKLWGEMGFYDAFNLGANWFATSYLAIDQGPIICMIENHRSRLLWNLFMANPEIQPALDAIGFVAEPVGASQGRPGTANWVLFPNPAGDILNVEFQNVKEETLSLDVLDLQGRLVRRVFENKKYPVGVLRENVAIDGLPPGMYLLRLKSEGGVFLKKWVRG